jgi:hypothetical protein
MGTPASRATSPIARCDSSGTTVPPARLWVFSSTINPVGDWWRCGVTAARTSSGRGMPPGRRHQPRQQPAITAMAPSSYS